MTGINEILIAAVKSENQKTFVVAPYEVVCYTAVFSVVRDDTKNDCVADYPRRASEILRGVVSKRRQFPRGLLLGVLFFRGTCTSKIADLIKT